MLEAAGDESRALALAQRRAAGEPLQYLTGVAGFRYLELAVGPGVLIPRPETEQVAERAINLLPAGGTLVDIGTGSGAIALATAHERPDARVFGTDVSHEALEWAERNRIRLGLDVELLQGDLFDALPAPMRGEIDVCVSNPPYVTQAEKGSLPRDVVEHEPAIALFVDGTTSVTERLVSEAPDWLRPGGWLVLEINEHYGAEVGSLFERHGYQDLFVEQDLTGRPRIAVGRARREHA